MIIELLDKGELVVLGDDKDIDYLYVSAYTVFGFTHSPST